MVKGQTVLTFQFKIFQPTKEKPASPSRMKILSEKDSHRHVPHAEPRAARDVTSLPALGSCLVQGKRPLPVPNRVSWAAGGWGLGLHGEEGGSFVYVGGVSALKPGLGRLALWPLGGTWGDAQDRPGVRGAGLCPGAVGGERSLLATVCLARSCSLRPSPGPGGDDMGCPRLSLSPRGHGTDRPHRCCLLSVLGQTELCPQTDCRRLGPY